MCVSSLFPPFFFLFSLLLCLFLFLLPSGRRTSSTNLKIFLANSSFLCLIVRKEFLGIFSNKRKKLKCNDDQYCQQRRSSICRKKKIKDEIRLKSTDHRDLLYRWKISMLTETSELKSLMKFDRFRSSFDIVSKRTNEQL